MTPREPALHGSDGPAIVRRWPGPIRVLHWATAVLVVVTIPAIYLAQALTEERTDAAEHLASLHILLGLIILAATLLRLALRIALPAPPPAGPGLLLRRLAALATAAFYTLLLAIPTTGILKLTLSGLDVSAFGVVLVPSPWRAPALARWLNRAHEWLANALMALAVAHAAMAVLHRRITGAAVMPRIV